MNSPTIHLKQRHPIKGSREFELNAHEIQYSSQALNSSDSLVVVLSVLNPEPVISGSTLSFVSEVNKEPLVEFFLDKPDKETFEQFISVMQSRILNEDFSRFRYREKMVVVDVDRLDETLRMLHSYVEASEIESLVAALTNLKEEPDNLTYFNDVTQAFNELGFVKGQVVTYAPYIAYLLSSSKRQADLLDK